MGEPPRGTLTDTRDPLRQRVRPSASAASIESVVNPISSPFARACRRRTSSSLCLDPSRQRSLLRLSLGPTSHQPSSVPGITPWSEPGFHLGLVGHRFVRSLEGAYPLLWDLQLPLGPCAGTDASPRPFSPGRLADTQSRSVTSPRFGPQLPDRPWTRSILYLSWDFHIAKTIAAICRAIVSFARLGRVPACRSAS